MFFVRDENNNLVEAYSAQEVLSVLEQAIADGSLANVVAGLAIIDKLKCCVSGKTNKVAFVDSAKYNELEAADTLEEDTAYFVTDDPTFDGLIENMNAILAGNKSVPQANNAATVGGEDAQKTFVRKEDWSIHNGWEKQDLTSDTTATKYNYQVSLSGKPSGLYEVMYHYFDSTNYPQYTHLGYVYYRNDVIGGCASPLAYILLADGTGFKTVRAQCGWGEHGNLFIRATDASFVKCGYLCYRKVASIPVFPDEEVAE